MIRVAAHQPAVTESEDEAIGCIRDALEHADAAGTDLVCFPECYIGGYFPNDRAATSRVAYEIGTPGFDALLQGIGLFDATLIVGITERRGDLLFNTALVIANGRLVGRYAKARPNEAFFTPGDSFPTFAVAGIRFGINICNDANYPETARAVADAGADGIVMPLNNLLRRKVAEDWRERHLANLVARARETGCWVVSSDIVGETEDRIAYGTTAVVDGRGRLLARVPEGEDGFLVHEIQELGAGPGVRTRQGGQ